MQARKTAVSRKAAKIKAAMIAPTVWEVVPQTVLVKSEAQVMFEASAPTI